MEVDCFSCSEHEFSIFGIRRTFNTFKGIEMEFKCRTTTAVISLAHVNDILYHRNQVCEIGKGFYTKVELSIKHEVIMIEFRICLRIHYS